MCKSYYVTASNEETKNKDLKPRIHTDTHGLKIPTKTRNIFSCLAGFRDFVEILKFLGVELKKIMRINIMLRLLLLAGFAGCAAEFKPFLVEGYRPPTSIAVMPVSNATRDADGAIAARYWLDRKLDEDRNYRTLDFETIDSVLNSLGVTEPSQLKKIPDKKLAEALNVKAIVYGVLLDFKYDMMSETPIKKIRVRFRMVEGKTGRVLWEAEGSALNAAETPEKPGGELKPEGRIEEKAWLYPLKAEVVEAVNRVLSTLPTAH